ncbi:MAG: hypothetical protein V1661_01750 [bacterium]
MHDSIQTIDGAIRELEKLKKILNRKKIDHVNTAEEKNLIKATAYSWIKSYKYKFNNFDGMADITAINNNYCELLNFSDKRIKRSLYRNLIKTLKSNLIHLRSEIVKRAPSGEMVNTNMGTMLDFSSLISDPAMVIIVKKRWAEIENCLKNDAPLASTVMMGGLLESVLMAKINALEDRGVLFRQKSTPMDAKTKKPKQLSEWMLKDYIDVSSEIKIITRPSAEFSRIIRDYRNYIHPEKELRTGESITTRDAKLFWMATVNLIEQILNI